MNLHHRVRILLKDCTKVLGNLISSSEWCTDVLVRYPADEEVADVGRRVIEADDVAEVAAEALDLRAALHVPQAARAVAR